MKPTSSLSYFLTFALITLLTSTPLYARTATYILYMQMIHVQAGPLNPVQISQQGEVVEEGDLFTIPAYNLADYGLGESFQLYMDAISGTTILIEEGGLDQNVVLRLYLKNLIVTGGGNTPFELIGVANPQHLNHRNLWMFIDLQVWSEGGGEQINGGDEDYDFQGDTRLVMTYPVDDEFAAMLAVFHLNYRQLGMAYWREGGWAQAGIEAGMVREGDEQYYRVSFEHLSEIGGAGDNGFDDNLDVPSEYETIQAAIDAAEEGETVLVAPGEYVENINFNGKNIALIGNPDNPEEVVIDGNGNGSVVTFANGESSSSNLNGFTVVNGSGTQTGNQEWAQYDVSHFGGGILCLESAPTIENCSVVGNTASSGGGIWLEGNSNPILSHLLIESNEATHFAGGIGCNSGSSPSLSDCAIIGNISADFGAGGIWFRNAETSLSRCIVANNTSGGEGGGINFTSTSAIISNCSIYGNNSGLYGGGIQLWNGSSVIMDNSILWSNSPDEVSFQEDHGANSIDVFFSCIAGGQDSIITNGNGEVNWGDGNISSDPRFIDPDNGDFRLHRTGPCRDSGDPDSPEDPDGTRADMGAYPYNYEGPITLNVPDEYATIQWAVDDAMDGDTVLVAPGTYRGEGRVGYTVYFPERTNLTLKSADGARSTIIDGEGGRGCVGLFGSRQINLEGFTLSGGVGGNQRSGGGLYAGYSDMKVVDCVIADNESEDFGGGAFLFSTDAEFIRCLITNNSSIGFGGGISFMSRYSLTIRNCTIANNSTANNQNGVGISVSGEIGNGANTAIYVLNSVVKLNGESDFAFIGGNYPHNDELYLDYSDIDYQGQFEGTGNISSDPLFLDPDNGDFRLQVASPCIDAGDPDSELDPDGTRADMGAYPIWQTFHRIPLRQGWNLLSSFNQPRDAVFPSVWEQVIGRGNLVMVKDQSGRFFNPNIGEDGFSNMQPWDVRQGYYGKLAQADTLVIVNVPTEVTTPIPLRQGWSMAAYFPEEELDVRDAFASVQNRLVLVKNDEGRFYIADRDFSNMPPLRRGKAYQVNTREDCELVYPEGGERLASLEFGVGSLELKKPEHFRPVEMTGGNMSLLLSIIIPTKVGIQSAEIGVFTASGLCVGAASYSSSSSSSSPLLGLALWSDDPTTPEIDGALEGEALSFRHWNGREETSLASASALAFATDGFAEVSIDLDSAAPAYPLSLILYPSYPNPFNSTTRVSFGMPEASHSNVSVFDLSGRLVATLAEGEFAAGVHSTVWNSGSAPAGLYIVKMQAGSYSESHKLTLVK